MKRKSHTKALKERTKERILGKGEASSSTSQTKIPHGTDAPAVPTCPKCGWSLIKGKLNPHCTTCFSFAASLPFPEMKPSGLSDEAIGFNHSPLSEMEARDAGLPEKFVQAYRELQPSLAQNVLSRLSVKLPSSPKVIPRGTPIE
jgi:hypothetical protein